MKERATLTALQEAVLDFLLAESRESHDRHPGDSCLPCEAKLYMRDRLNGEVAGYGVEVPIPEPCTVSDREARDARLLMRFGSLRLALMRLESNAKAYTTNQQMAEAARAWSKYHAVQAELLELEPSLAGIRWEDFK